MSAETTPTSVTSTHAVRTPTEVTIVFAIDDTREMAELAQVCLARREFPSRHVHTGSCGTQSHYSGFYFSGHNFPIDGARELSKPSEEAESLPSAILKNLGTFGFELFWGDVMSGWGQGIFGSCHRGLKKIYKG